LALAGCASTSPLGAVRDTSDLVQRRSGHTIHWSVDHEAEVHARKGVSRLLAEPLTLEHAIRVSLLANAKLQATVEELGVAQADWVQAGLLKNPTVGATYDVAITKGGGASFQAGFVGDLLQLLTLGPRKNLARLGLEAVKYRVASEVIHHIYHVKAAFIATQAAQQTFSMRQIVMTSGQAAVELARRQHEAGTINDLDLANQEALFAQVTTDLSRSRAEVTTARERLNRVMGVWGSDAGWRLNEKLAELPATEPSVEHIESKAILNSYDVSAARKDVEIVAYGLSLAKNTRWIGGIDAGIDFHREQEGVRLLGPTVSVELPLFDQRQAAVARIEAQLRQARHREVRVAVDLRSEVRELSARVAVARSVVDTYQHTLVPQREKIVALSQQQYDAMLLGVFQLLVAKQNEIATYREFIEAVRDYWLLRAELEWRVGGELVESVPPPVAKPASSPTESGNSHVHHTP
jgi:cobalt-zinc-cadmium efflux system outer membrane protein